MELTKVSGHKIPQGFAWNPSLEELLTPKLQVVDKKEHASGTVYAKVKDNYRKKVNIEELYGVVLDIDKSPTDVLPMLIEALQGYQGYINTTFSHDPRHEKYCYRAFINSESPIKPEDYEAGFINLVNSNPILCELKEKGILDMSAKDVGRFFYDFSCPPEREDVAYFHALGGMPLIPDTRKQVTNNISSSSESGVVQRNISLTKEVGRLVQLHRQKETVIREALIFNEKFNPPLDTQEAMTVINSIWKKHFADNPDDKPIELSQKTKSRFTIFTNKDYEKQEDMEWLIDSLVIRRTINMIVGKSGDTKSFLALHMGLGLAHNQSFFGLDSDNDNEIPVIFNALEGAYGLKNRIDGWCKHYRLEHPDNFRVLEGNPILNDDKSVDEYIEYLQSINFKDGLLFIDTYNQATPSMDENSAGATGQVMANCQKIIQTTRATIFLIHHTGKSDDSEYRGSSAIMGSLDTMIRVKNTGKDWYEWTIKKIKDGEVGTSYKYKTHQIDLGVTAKGRKKNTLIIEEGNITKAKGQRQKLASTQQWVFDLIVKRLEGYPNGDEYNEVKESVKHMMGDQVEQNKKGNLFDTKVKEFQVKNLLKVGVNYPEDKTIIQVKES